MPSGVEPEVALRDQSGQRGAPLVAHTVTHRVDEGPISALPGARPSRGRSAYPARRPPTHASAQRTGRTSCGAARAAALSPAAPPHLRRSLTVRLPSCSVGRCVQSLSVLPPFPLSPGRFPSTAEGDGRCSSKPRTRASTALCYTYSESAPSSVRSPAGRIVTSIVYVVCVYL